MKIFSQQNNSLELLCFYTSLSLCFLTVAVVHIVASSCNQIFVSQPGGPRHGQFRSPIRMTRNLSGNITRSYFTQCVYKFVAGPDERAYVNFTTFQLRDSEPSCNREYMDIFIQLEDVNNIDDLVTSSPLSGRYCGTVTPRPRISLFRVLVLSFHTDLAPLYDRPLFSGNYEFISAHPYEHIESSESNQLCHYTIRSNLKKEGEFQSITYPGVYAKGLKCSYRLLGENGQRVRLEFLDFDLYSGGPHCPFDVVKIYDGSSESAPLINTLCGSHRSLVIYSSNQDLLVTFTTLPRETDVQNRGFSAYFEFSDRFVSLDFISQNDGKHIRGSECDQRIISHRGSMGTIISPTSTFHPNTICRYIFEGLQNSLDYERVALRFLEFDLKQTSNTSTSNSSPVTTVAYGGQPTNSVVSAEQPANSINMTQDQCPDNYVRIYTEEQKPDQKQDPNDYDYVFCGNTTSDIPGTIESDAASLLMEYNSGSITGAFFKANYSFLVDYRIPGTQAPPDCSYTYLSDSIKSGSINSPRHPSYYLNNIDCEYTFHTKEGEMLLLEFTAFNLNETSLKGAAGYNEACKNEDRIEIYEMQWDNGNQHQLAQTMKTIGVYCGNTAPGPLMRYKPIKILFKTDKNRVAYGFSATYTFYPVERLKTHEFQTRCGGFISTLNQKIYNGTIDNPITYRPETYVKRHHYCQWNITARPQHKIMLHFEKFAIEGSPAFWGCPNVIVRISSSNTESTLELCGTLDSIANSSRHIISSSEWMSITYVTNHLKHTQIFFFIIVDKKLIQKQKILIF